ncbi:hypothetical protein [Leekyejoonella antrihumi]|uniref:Uncharacterized protein n=1 Tax=Leekyejoonella antrihumi TaxID=1660198 RepID=A0A563DWX2_9MICO|nr:hypothetical protein [Leekyejoonella antrihumi]TWP34726.1 hypothetical protein FGL98_16605 [Leekyejoonella antrihumi]
MSAYALLTTEDGNILLRWYNGSAQADPRCFFGGDLVRPQLAFDPDHISDAMVLAAVSGRAEVLDLSIEDPEIEDVVRRIYHSRM